MGNEKKTNAVEDWWKQVHLKTMGKQPIESGVSLPIPLAGADAPRMAVIYYGTSRVAEENARVATPPLALVIAAYPSGEVAQIVDRRESELFPELPASGVLGPLVDHPAPYEQRKQAKKRVYELYPAVLAAFWEKNPIEEVKEFRDLFWQIEPECLKPYYQATSPEFFAFLEE